MLLSIGFISPHTSTFCEAVEYYVTPTPTPNPECPVDKPCHTIDEYAQRSSEFFNDQASISLLFLNGIHNLTFGSIMITDIKLFEMNSLRAIRGVYTNYPNFTVSIRIMCEECNITVQNGDLVKLEHILVISNADYRDQTRTTIRMVNISAVRKNIVALQKCNVVLYNVSNAELLEAEYDQSLLSIIAPSTTSVIEVSGSKFNESKLQLEHSIGNNLITGYTVLNFTNCILQNTGLFTFVFPDPSDNEVDSDATVQLNIRNSTLSAQPLLPNIASFSRIIVQIMNPSTFILQIADCNVSNYESGVDVSTVDNVNLDFKLADTVIHFNGVNFVAISIRTKANCLVNTDIIRSQIVNGVGIHIETTDYSGVRIAIQDSIITDSKQYALSVDTGIYNNASLHIAKTMIADCLTGILVFVDRQTNLEMILEDTSITNTRTQGLSILSPEAHIRFSLIRSNVSRAGTTAIEISVNYDASAEVDKSTINMYIQDSHVTNSFDGGLYVYYSNPKEIDVKALDTTFEHNRGISFRVYSENEHAGIHGRNYSISRIVLQNVSFVNNHDYHQSPVTMELTHANNVNVEDGLFEKNLGTPIQAYLSDIVISGYTMFLDNTAEQGGAVSLHLCRMYITNNTVILAQNNTATEVGGALYVETLPHPFRFPYNCFYQLLDIPQFSDDVNVELISVNNSANNGGEGLYGAPLRSLCRVGNLPSYQVYNKLFSFDDKQSGMSTISSNPKKPCLCETGGKPNCTDISLIFVDETRYPGEIFDLSAVIVGEEFGTVTGTVFAQLLPSVNQSSSISSLGPHQHIQPANFARCNDLSYSVNSYNTMELIVLTTVDAPITELANRNVIQSHIQSYNGDKVIPDELLTVPIFINVTLEKCPSGFELIGHPPNCECKTILKENGLHNCVIVNRTGYVYRSGTVWVHAISQKNKTSDVIVHRYCPFGYCRSENISIDLNHPDEQCTLNHSGILCGACQPNLTLAIGSSNCLPCLNNNHVALLIAFAAAGFVLVLFIKILNMTVAQGTINGLIFYANIVWANQSILFPNQTETSGFLQFLKTFLAWLNLDLGIETCFILGLDAYWKTWLQFVFPIYVWTIAGLIILVSHYSSKVTKLIGNNSVPVLATLFLLSYAKLLRTIIIALGFTVLDYPDGPRLIWSFDGNVPYFGLKHTFLFLTAVVTLMLLWLPYTFTLLCIQFLWKYSEYRLLRWVNTFKPFFDAYVGPFKDKHVYWVGLLLLARVVLLVIFASTSAIAPSINLVMIISVVSVLSLQACNVYKSLKMSILESSFLINLILFSSGSLFIEINGGSKESLACTSVGLTFLQFVAIVTYHVYKRFCSCKVKENRRVGYTELDEDELEQLKIMARQNVPESARLREPLLESSDSVDTY